METTYKKSKGNAGLKGVQFQLDLLTVSLMNAFHHHNNWKISSENQNAGKYDDIVIELPHDAAVLIQSKHKENKKITKEQLLSDNSKNYDFSLPKYFFSYLEIKSKFRTRTVIICTNTSINKKGLENILNCHPAGSDSILHYEGDGCSFSTFNENIILLDLKKSAEVYLNNNLQGKGIDRAVITDENLKDFLKNIQIFSCYPCGDDLHKVMEQLLCRLSHSSLWSKISIQEILRKIENWFKHPKGEYLTNVRTKAMICEIKSDKYCEWLKHHEASFEYNDFDFTDSKRIFCVKAEGGCLLQMLKIYRALEHNKTKKLYVNPEDVKTKRQMIEAFQLQRYGFLIMTWSEMKYETIGSERSSILKNTLEKYRYKKLILVVEDNSNLTQCFGLEDISQVDGFVTFKDLSRESQDKLLKHRNVLFQGNIVTLEEVLHTKSIEDYTKSLHSGMLEMLVKREQLRVGSKRLDFNDDVSRYYISRTFERQVTELRTRQDPVPEEDLFHMTEKVVLISGSAGIGKSTVLTKIAGRIKEKNPHLWIVRINLTDYTRILKEYSSQNRNRIGVVELLNSNESSKLTNEFEKLIFSMYEKVVLMLDGVDEVSPDYTGLILNLLDQCQNASNFVKVFVTTRPHMILELETVLNVGSYKMLPFTRSNEVDFLMNYWEYNLQLDETNKYKYMQFAKALIYKMSSWLTSYYRENTLTAIPLQVRMLAEIFQEGNYADLEGLEKLNIASLYSTFIEKRRDVFLSKENPSGNVATNTALLSQFEECLLCHRSLALRVILDKSKIDLFPNCHPNDNNLNDYALRIGIVQRLGDDFQFIHRTFAEYFVAESIIRELKFQNPNVAFHAFFINKILVFDRFKVVRAFLEVLLEADLPPDVLKHYQSFTVKSNLNLIFQLAQNGQVTILQFILRSINFKIVKGKAINIRSWRLKLTSKKRNTLNDLEVLVHKAGVNIRNDLGETPLHSAVVGGQLKMVDFLVQQGADVNIRDNRGNTALHFAVNKNNANIVKSLIGYGTKLNIKDCRGQTALHLAVRHVDIVKNFVQHNADLNVTDDKGRTALQLAARRYFMDTVKYLVENGADINNRDSLGYTALHLIVEFGTLHAVKYLVDQGADINLKDDEGRTALDLASELSKKSALKHVLSHYVDINNGDHTKLRLVVRKRTIDTVQYLIEYSAGIDLRVDTKEGAFSSYDIIDEYLLKDFAGVNHTDSEGRAVIHLAAELNMLDAVKYLVEHDTDVNLKDGKGCTALHLSSGLGRLNIVRYLVKHGADVNVRDDEGCTSLHLAVEGNHLDIVKYLVQHSADVSMRNNRNLNALYIAVELNLRDTVKYLLEHCDDVEVRDDKGTRAMLSFIKWDDFDTVEHLVEQGVDANVKDCGSRTAQHLAAGKYYMDTVKNILKGRTNRDENDYTALLSVIGRGD